MLRLPFRKFNNKFHDKWSHIERRVLYFRKEIDLRIIYQVKPDFSWDHPDCRQQHHHYHHQHVTRIASAPDSYRAWPPRSTALVPPSRVQRLGMSDPQLNLQPSSPSTSSLHVPWGTQQVQDVRRRLHYHLANIFPEEQVQTVMALHPHETDPQQICAAILTMFPKN